MKYIAKKSKVTNTYVHGQDLYHFRKCLNVKRVYCFIALMSNCSEIIQSYYFIKWRDYEFECAVRYIHMAFLFMNVNLLTKCHP